MDSRNLLITCLVFLQIFTFGNCSFRKKRTTSNNRLEDSEVTDDPLCQFIGCAGLCVDDTDNCCDCPACERPCFPASSKVSLENGKSTTMSELKVGDKVRTVSLDGTLMYSKITTFLKKQQTTMAPYMSIRTSGNQTITLSGSHLIYSRKNSVDKFNPIYGYQVAIGDEVLVQGNDNLKSAKVFSTSSVKMQGILIVYSQGYNYFPFDIPTSFEFYGVLASCLIMIWLTLH